MFVTDLVVRAMLDRDLQWQLVQDLIWESPTETITVPAGFITDLASIPMAFRSILKQNGKSRRAAVLHDFLYSRSPFSRDYVDKIFLQALIADKVSRLGRWAYYLGVRVGGFLPFNRYRNRQ